MSDSKENNPLVRRPRTKKSSSSGQKSSLAYEVVDGTVVEIVDGQKRRLSDEPSHKDKGKSEKRKGSSRSIAEALRIMKSYGYSTKTPEEKRIALNDYTRINKRAAKKGQAPLKERDSSVYASISREQFPKSGSGFKVVSGGVETNRRKH